MPYYYVNNDLYKAWSICKVVNLWKKNTKLH